MRGFRFLTVAALFAVTVLLLAAAPAFAATTLPQDDIWYDNTQALKNVAPPAQTAPLGSALNEILAAGEIYDEATADFIITLTSDDPNNPETFDVAFWKEYEGEHADIYIGWNDLTPPEASGQQDHEITAEQIAYMGAEFDAKIWESDVFHFGNYDARVYEPGMDGSRAAILVYNIRDEAYYSDYPYYIAGYFWGGFNDAMQINAIFIDSYNWVDRLGEDVDRPYLYESVVAHEFQHLIHHDVDADEDGFVDEGMACIAEQLLYGNYASAGQIGSYLWLHRDSLITWNGVALEDYGSVTLWSDYLWEQVPGYEDRIPMMAPLEERVASGYEDDMFAETDAKFADPGDALIWNIMHNQTNGLLGQAECIPGGMEEVERLFHDWTLANLLDGKVDEPQWNYTNLEIGTEDSDFVTIDTGINFYKTGYNYAMPTMKPAERRAMTEPWGAYYRYLKATAKKPVTVVFKGVAETGLPPTTGTYEWYGGMGAMMTNTLTRQIEGVPEGATLDFLTWFDIEAEWDYGYVEASSDGENWTVLPQLSSLRVATEDVNGSTAFDGVGGFTGKSDDWQAASFDLAGFSGTVFVRFRYMTDEAVNGQGWYVDDISVGNADGDVFVDPCDTENDWVSEGWSFTTGLQANDWTADAYAAYKEGADVPYVVSSIVGPEVEPGLRGRTTISTTRISGKIYGIVSNHPDGTFAAPAKITITKGKAKRT